MHTLRRRSTRRHHYRAAKIQLGGDTPVRDCLVINISKGGVRLNVEGLDVPDEFVLFLSSDEIVQESMCKVAWRFGDEVGAKFVAVVGRPDFVVRKDFPLRKIARGVFLY
jgi:PilZ domain